MMGTGGIERAWWGGWSWLDRRYPWLERADRAGSRFAPPFLLERICLCCSDTSGKERSPLRSGMNSRLSSLWSTSSPLGR